MKLHIEFDAPIHEVSMCCRLGAEFHTLCIFQLPILKELLGLMERCNVILDMECGGKASARESNTVDSIKINIINNKTKCLLNYWIFACPYINWYSSTIGGVFFPNTWSENLVNFECIYSQISKGDVWDKSETLDTRPMDSKSWNSHILLIKEEDKPWPRGWK